MAYTGVTNDGIPNNYIGHYSSVGVFKFTTLPEVYVENLNSSNVNVHLDNYIGVYKNLDQSERVYSYQFNLYNENGE